jgi:hypothetical protein
MRSWTIVYLLFLLGGCENGGGGTGGQNRCDPDPCVNGVCTDGVDSCSCTCDPGWQGALCDVNIDDCDPNPCVSGDCTDEVNGYNCTCDPGWEGPDCSVLECSQVSMDRYEGNDSCALAEPLPDSAEGAEAVTVSDPTLHHTDQTLDTDWYEILATEGDPTCMPGFSQCYLIFDIAFTPPDIAAYATYEMCISRGSCGSDETCTTGADWNEGKVRYELSISWEGVCGFTDDAQFYVKITRDGEQESCAQYSLEYQMTYTDEPCP